jgi:hypothetical protein
MLDFLQSLQFSKRRVWPTRDIASARRGFKSRVALPIAADAGRQCRDLGHKKSRLKQSFKPALSSPAFKFDGAWPATPAGGWGADESERIRAKPDGDQQMFSRFRGARWAPKGQNCEFEASSTPALRPGKSNTFNPFCGKRRSVTRKNVKRDWPP